MNEPNLSRAFVESLSSEARQLWLIEISRFLTERILRAANFELEVTNIIGELRLLGHDIWSFDEDDEWQIWCGNWIKSENSGKLNLHFRSADGVQATWNEHK